LEKLVDPAPLFQMHLSKLVRRDVADEPATARYSGWNILAAFKNPAGDPGICRSLIAAQRGGNRCE
jgi:hypothetical protein